MKVYVLRGHIKNFENLTLNTGFTVKQKGSGNIMYHFSLSPLRCDN